MDQVGHLGENIAYSTIDSRECFDAQIFCIHLLTNNLTHCVEPVALIPGSVAL